MRHRIAGVLLVAVALLTTLGWTGQCWAQAKIARIGFLTPASGGVWPEFVAALRALGYVENQTITFEVRAAGDNLNRLPELAAELVRSKVDIIVAVSPPAILAARQATSTIPVVMGFWGGEGLLESGLVASFARPGGNVTGVYMLAAELDAKRLELLLEALPNARKVAVLNPGDGWTFTEVRQAARAAGIQLHITDPPGWKATTASLTQWPGRVSMPSWYCPFRGSILSTSALSRRQRSVVSRRCMSGARSRETEG
jgi:ABC-type uncharacterized transport system substrate-binding protein